MLQGGLNTAHWSEVTISPAVVGEEKQVIFAPPTANRLYRLRQYFKIPGANRPASSP